MNALKCLTLASYMYMYTALSIVMDTIHGNDGIQYCKNVCVS